MGRASNRKKAQRQAGPGSRQARPDPRIEAAMQPLVLGLGAMVEEARVRVERQHAALQAWYGDAEPVSAEVPPWPENSLGDRFLVGYLGEVQDAPSLLTRGTVGTVAALSGARSLLDGTPTLSRPFSRNSFDNGIVNHIDSIVTWKPRISR